jgi:hypothetical protein
MFMPARKFITLLLLIPLLAIPVQATAAMLGAVTRALKNSDNAISSAAKSNAILRGALSVSDLKTPDPPLPPVAPINSSITVEPQVMPIDSTVVMAWMPSRLAVCVTRMAAANLNNDAAISSCATRYKNCIEEKSIENGLQTPSEVCINKTNREVSR